MEIKVNLSLSMLEGPLTQQVRPNENTVIIFLCSVQLCQGVFHRTPHTTEEQRKALCRSTF